MCGAWRSGSRPKIVSSGTSVAGSNCCIHRVKERNGFSRLAQVRGSTLACESRRAHSVMTSKVKGPR
jgi:hypothetical protein